MTIKLKDADEMDLTTLPVDQLRQLYGSYRKALLYLVSRVELDAHQSRVKPVSPVEWIESIKTCRDECSRCRGTGIYSWGACVNGKMTHSGHCYRCDGKGWVGLDDARRAFGYDNYAISKALGF